MRCHLLARGVMRLSIAEAWRSAAIIAVESYCFCVRFSPCVTFWFWNQP